MTSMLPDLERDLVAAASRHAASPAAARRRSGVGLRWLRDRSRPVQALLGLLIVSAAAASAATLAGTSSAPLSGAVSTNVRYRITISPYVSAGAVGWCITDQQTTLAGRPLSGMGACGSDTATLGSPLFAPLQGPTIAVMTAPDVAAVRVVGGPTILTRGDPSLPFGFRAAVYNAERRLTGVTVLRRELFVALDTSGHAIARSGTTQPLPPFEGGRGAPLPTRAWARAGWDSQLSGLVIAFPHQGGLVQHAPPTGACTAIARPGSGLRARGGVDVIQIVADPAIIGRAFLDCSDTLYTDRDGPLVVSMLLDATNPGSRPAALPDMQPLNDEPGIFTIPGSLSLMGRHAVARFVGHAWLVASGPGTTAQHANALRQLSVSSIRLSPLVDPHGPRGVPCSISYQPLSGLIETIQTPWRGAPPAWGPNPRLYPCTDATFYLDNWPLEARILAPIREPGTPHHPTLHPIPGHPGAFAVDTNGYTGPGVWRRVGRVWLIVTGGSSTQQELSLSDRLTVATTPT